MLSSLLLHYFVILLQAHCILNWFNLYDKCSIKLQMQGPKVIKQLKKQSIQQQIYLFFHTIPIITKMLFPLTLFASILLLFAQPNIPLPFIATRISQILIFSLIGLTDLSKFELKGSLFLIVNYLLNSIFLWLLTWGVSYLINWEELSMVATTIPMQFLIWVATSQAMEKGQEVRYLICQPLQVKNIWYLFTFVLVLQLIDWRLDLIYILLLSALSSTLKLSSLLRKGLMKLEKAACKSCTLRGYISIQDPAKPETKVTNMETSNSVFLQEK